MEPSRTRKSHVIGEFGSCLHSRSERTQSCRIVNSTNGRSPRSSLSKCSGELARYHTSTCAPSRQIVRQGLIKSLMHYAPKLPRMDSWELASMDRGKKRSSGMRMKGRRSRRRQLDCWCRCPFHQKRGILNLLLTLLQRCLGTAQPDFMAGVYIRGKPLGADVVCTALSFIVTEPFLKRYLKRYFPDFHSAEGDQFPRRICLLLYQRSSIGATIGISSSKQEERNWSANAAS
jgi:hypothetical protein